MVSHRGTTVIAQEMVFLVVAATEKLEGARVGVVADSLENHVVSLLDGAETDVFHGLDEGERPAVSLLGLILKVHGESRLVVDVVATPEGHAGSPEDNEFGTATPNVGHLVEKLAATLLTEVTVAEHGRVCVEVTDTRRPLGD